MRLTAGGGLLVRERERERRRRKKRLMTILQTMFATLAAMIATGTLARSIPYDNTLAKVRT